MPTSPSICWGRYIREGIHNRGIHKSGTASPLLNYGSVKFQMSRRSGPLHYILLAPQRMESREPRFRLPHSLIRDTQTLWIHLWRVILPGCGIVQTVCRCDIEVCPPSPFRKVFIRRCKGAHVSDSGREKHHRIARIWVPLTPPYFSGKR